MNNVAYMLIANYDYEGYGQPSVCWLRKPTEKDIFEFLYKRYNSSMFDRGRAIAEDVKDIMNDKTSRNFCYELIEIDVEP